MTDDLFSASDALKAKNNGKAPVGRPPERIRVIVRMRQRGGDPIEEDLLWPKGWPLPDSGSIFSGHTIGGWVEHVEFDVVAQRVIVVLR